MSQVKQILQEGFMIMRTRGFISEIHPDVQAKIMGYAMARITPKTDMIVMDPGCQENRFEDGGITLRTVNPWTKKKIYVKLDDFKDPETWDEIYEPEIAEELRKAPGCRWVITFMFAEEY